MQIKSNSNSNITPSVEVTTKEVQTILKKITFHLKNLWEKSPFKKNEKNKNNEIALCCLYDRRNSTTKQYEILINIVLKLGYAMKKIEVKGIQRWMNLLQCFWEFLTWESIYMLRKDFFTNTVLIIFSNHFRSEYWKLFRNGPDKYSNLR